MFKKFSFILKTKKNNVIKRNQKNSLKKKKRISKGDDEPKKN
jgi:hypothetical protein